MRIELKDENQEEPQKIDENDIRYKHETDLTKKEKRELEKMKLASMGWKGKLLIGALLLFLLILLILALLRRKKKKDEPAEGEAIPTERGSTNEISNQSGSDTADASAAVSPRDGTPR